MPLLAQFKEVADIVKKMGDVPLYRQIVELEGEVVNLSPMENKSARCTAR